MSIILFVATILLLAATLLPLWRNPHWIIRSLDFPRLQFAAAGIILLLAQCFFLDRGEPLAWLQLVAVLGCIAWQVHWIAPYTALWPREVRPANDPHPDHELSIITANVLTTNRDASALLALVRKLNPDILVTLESDQWWQDQLEILESDMPYTLNCPLDNLYGMHVWSRIPLEDTSIKYLVQDDVPSMHALLKLPCGDRVRMHFLHPMPPSPSEAEESTERDVELVIVARSVADGDGPVIVTGDLNDVAWSSTTRLFRIISRLLDPRVGRGMFNTFHASYPFLRWPLDHLFHSKHFSVISLQRLSAIGSDHFPLYSKLLYTRAAKSSGNGNGTAPQADGDDKSRTRSIAGQDEVSKNDVPEPGESA